MERIWSDHTPDSGAVHCLGNGDFLIYSQGPVLTQLQGPPYTAPSFGKLFPLSDAPLSAISYQETNANFWRHCLHCAEKSAEFLDYLLPDAPVFVREFHTDFPLRLHLQPETGVDSFFWKKFAPLGGRHDCLALRLPMGHRFFTSLATEQETWLLVTGDGVLADAAGCLQLNGSGRILLAAGSLPDAVGQLRRALNQSSECLRAQVVEDWKRFFARVNDLGARLPQEVPANLCQKTSQACRSVAALIRCQQSRSGGILAGHPYPLAYTRDMAGTLRGLLSLGLYPEARSILLFWRDRFTQYGDIRNAEGMGNQGARLYFPNDRVEVPAYLILSAFRYAECTGEQELLDELAPLLYWAFEVQLPELGGGMTGFSGDETYIAGGTLPRVQMYDGSAESTLLFLEGGEELLCWARQHDRIPQTRLLRWQEALAQARAAYKKNFCRGGLLYANQPARLQYCTKPAFAHGFCEVHDLLQHELVLGWLLYDPASDYYCCPDCYGKPHACPVDKKQQHLLSSVSLLPAFYESSLFSQKEIAAAAAPYLKLFEEKGFLPSNAAGNRALGYDSGLLLYTLSVLRHPLRIQALASMLALLDDTGAWVEYYDNGVPFNCRCRPWESGVNIDAIRRLTESF